jgi:CheY-like chemotaxis protein
LARHLRTEKETAHALLIAATGYGQENDKLNSIAAGFDHYLVKPVDISKLTGLLDQYRP